MRYAMGLVLMGTAAQASDLNIYTYDSFAGEWGPGPAIEEGFEAICDCDIEFTTAGDGGSLLARLRIEGDNTDADVVLGLDQNLAPQFDAQEFFADHDLGAQELSGADMAWVHPQLRAYDWGQIAFVYDLDRWTQAERADPIPASLEQLANGDATVLIENPRASTPGLSLALWVYDVYGDQSEDYWSRLKDNIVTITPGWSEAYSLFLEGEADMVLSYTTSPAYHRIAEGENQYMAASFQEGHALQIELVGITNASENFDLAQKFVKFLESDAAQKALYERNWMYPVVEMDLPEGFDAPTAFISRPMDVGEQRIEAALKAFDDGLN